MRGDGVTKPPTHPAPVKEVISNVDQYIGFTEAMWERLGARKKEEKEVNGKQQVREVTAERRTVKNAKEMSALTRILLSSRGHGLSPGDADIRNVRLMKDLDRDAKKNTELGALMRKDSQSGGRQPHSRAAAGRA